jgi:hypothetical protein
MDSAAPLFHINLLRQYINALSVNIKVEPEPKQLNLIFDSGAVNGLMGIGAALYLKHLEKINYIKINKISGCSIGSLIAVWYICGCPDTMYEDIDTLFKHYKSNKNFFIFEQVVKKTIRQLFTTDEDIRKLNDVLHINYYDTQDARQCVVSKFKDSTHLLTCILRSSHIPFLTNNCHKYEGRYVDGIAPYLFEEGNNLFIQLIKFTSPLKSLNIKKEKNIYSRLIRGVVDTNEFFINDCSKLCSYVNYKTKLHLCARQYFVFFILYLIEWFIYFKKIIPHTFKKTVLYNKLCSYFHFIWLHILDKLA